MKLPGTIIGLLSLALSAMPVVAQEDMRPPPRPGTAPDAVATPRVSGPASELAIAVLESVPVPRPADLLEGYQFKLALAAAYRDDWAEAARLAAGDPVGANVIEWRRLRSGEGTFGDYRAFLARNGDWPGLDLLRRRGEDTIPEGADAASVIGYFNTSPPQTGRGVLRLAEALAATGARDKAQAVVVRAWQELEMDAGEEAAILAKWGDTVAPHHAARLDMFLWADERTGSTRMMSRVSAGRKALAEARLALQAEAPGVDALIERVPAELRGDGGLAYDRMYWRIEKRRRDEAADVILEQSTSAAALGRPEEWGNWRRILTRQAMRDGNGQRAYNLASRHFIAHTTENYDYADLEWLSGYLALRYLNDPATALTHFRRFTSAVFTPISLGRGHYWEGRALEAMGDTEAAMASYRKGGAHQTSFYGLLAAEKAGMAMDPVLTGRGPVADWRAASFAGGSVQKAAELLFYADARWETIRFLSHLADTLPTTELEALGEYTLTLGDPYVSVRVAKRAVRSGAVAIRAYYPLTDLGIDLPVEEALALAIARRESEFNIGAVSPAGARGLMQLMPATAQIMSRKVGLRYAAAKLTTDPVFNATLGSAYLAELIDEFGKNYVLVSAGYNAGPGRPRRWIELYGDPRDPGTDPVDWIEHIPFRETRNYAMRVTESLPIYRALLTGEVQPIRLLEELKAR